MKKLTFLVLTIGLVFASCSTEDAPLTDSEVQDLVVETNTTRAGAPTRVSVTGNSDFALNARLRSDGTASGSWRDNQNGQRVQVNCINIYDLAGSSYAILSGTVVRGNNMGANVLVQVKDGQADGISFRPATPMFDCNTINPSSLFPMPISSGNVKISN